MALFERLLSYWQRLRTFLRHCRRPVSTPAYQPPKTVRIRHPRKHSSRKSDDETRTVPIDPFLLSLHGLIDSNITQSGFGVGELAEQVGLSRIHLYRKVKGLTGMTATEFLRNYRLRRAIEYLRAGHTVAETSQLVGFESPAYFTKCFREHYHMPPTVFLATQL
ncbi:hypothetical protein GCM10027299_26690 [Larkinella ripae]